MIPIVIALIALVSLTALCAWLGRKAGTHFHGAFVCRHLNPHDVAWNSQLGKSEHADGMMGKLADAPILTRYLLVKRGSDANHIAQVAAAADVPYGVCVDQPYAQGDSATTRLLNASKGTQTMIANGAIALDVDVFSDGTGKVGTEATVLTAAGIYWLVGKTVGKDAAAAAGDMIEVEAVRPIKVVVLAALTSAQAGAAPTQAQFNALQADVAAIATATAHPCLLKHL